MPATNRAALPPPKYLQVNFDAMCDDEITPLLRLGASMSVELNIENYRKVLAIAARNEGASWSKIAGALGVTRQAAYARYGIGLPDDGK